jgi:hypothetical protein
MRTMIDKQDWQAFLGDLSRRNAGRPTRLGVFSPSYGTIADYWLEDGLPLVGMFRVWTISRTARQKRA